MGKTMQDEPWNDEEHGGLRAVERRGSDSMKWRRYADQDVLPLWVADMDFAVPEAVQQALAERVAHGVFGYAEPSAGLVEAVQAHLQDCYGWQIEPNWLVWLPGLVSGLNVACRAVGEVGDGIFTATPVYPPFLSAPGLSGRQLHTQPLHQGERRWEWDWAAVDGSWAANTCGWLLCHPHNPVGRAWEREDLAAIAERCERHDLVLISDEIHCDLLLVDRPHLPAAMYSPELASRTITLMAPSKTFNVPGLGCSFAIIPDAVLRRRFRAAMAGIVPHVNVLGLVAAEAAFRHGQAWRQELLVLLRQHAERVAATVADLPGVAMHPVEATYLAWLDVRGLGWEAPQRRLEAAGLGLSDGGEFGAPGFVRLNFGCSTTTLEEALRRLRRAVAGAVG
jgi:cystathionine beta-lyase